MRLNFSPSWTVRGWIACALVTFYAQSAVSKSECDETHYLKDSRCCKKCEAGFRVYSDCTDSDQTICVKCDPGEYQPGWTQERRCLQQKVCDPGKGFMKRPENPVAEEPCRCHSGLQCSPINCEYCERVPTCSPGYGLEMDPEFTNGRKICDVCKKGFFSADSSSEHCKPWTNCKAEGRSETQPGSAQADAVCGQPVSSGPSWVIVSVLSVITVLCLLILLLFCYKDKLKLLSVNLRSCVQNLKRTRIQQETLAPLYHSGAGGGLAGGPGGPKCTPCETTKLICQAPCGPADQPPRGLPTDVRVSLPFAEEEGTKAGAGAATEDQSEGSGEPEEVSEDEEAGGAASPLVAGSCACVVPIHEPLEVGENEDCSQAVSPGTPGTCSCGGLDGERDGDEGVREGRGEGAGARADKGGERSDGGQSKALWPKGEAGAASLVSLSPALPPFGPSPELCLPLSQAQMRPKFKPHPTDGSQAKQEGLHGPAGTESASAESHAAPAVTSLSPLVTSSCGGGLHLDKPPEAAGADHGHGVSWGDCRGNKLSSAESELECSPESLHSQLAEPTLTSGQVSGSNNTTFISSGQVMNFSGDVIVVYVSQTSSGGGGGGGGGGGQDDAFGSPVQEEASETAPLSRRGAPRSRGGSVSRCTSRDETLPVQELEERPAGKRNAAAQPSPP